MVEERTAERRLEKPVGDHIARRAEDVQVLIDRQFRRVIVSHHETGRIAAGDIPVLLTLIYLVLFVVEAVHEVARTPARKTLPVQDPVRSEYPGRWTRRIGGLDVGVDLERLVLEGALEHRSG